MKYKNVVGKRKKEYHRKFKEKNELLCIQSYGFRIILYLIKTYEVSMWG